MSAGVHVILRNDDLCALSDAGKERRVLEIFERLRIPQVYSVIPQMCEDPHNYAGTRFHPLEENPQVVALIKEYVGK